MPAPAPANATQTARTTRQYHAARVEKTDAEWRSTLSIPAYAVTRQKGTEHPFSGQYWDHRATGIYRCICCGTALFASDTKFDAGCGWPSYFAPITPGCVREVPDHSRGMIRTEIICQTCDAHLGHVFPDGPPPTGLRYCINSVALRFEPLEHTLGHTPDQAPDPANTTEHCAQPGL